MKSSTPTEPAKETQPAKPDAPTPKIDGSSESEAEAGVTPGGNAILAGPVKPATGESFETPRKKMIWYGLVFASHGAAAFDAWTTRRAVSAGYGVEGDPLQRPFANSGAIYATTQVSPLIMDYLGRRLMRSRYPWMRRMW